MNSMETKRNKQSSLLDHFKSENMKEPIDRSNIGRKRKFDKALSKETRDTSNEIASNNSEMDTTNVSNLFPIFHSSRQLRQTCEPEKIDLNTFHKNFHQASSLLELLKVRVRACGDNEKEALSSSICIDQAKLYPMTQDGASWVIHVPALFPCKNEYQFKSVWDIHPTTKKDLGHIFGRPAFENRYSQSFGVMYSYSRYKDDTAKSLDAEKSASYLVKEVNDIISNVNEFGWGPYNGCLMNWYEPEHNIAAHADDESSMKSNSPIFSFSWGGPRRFVVKPIVKGRRAAKSALSADLLIRDGDLLVMGGTLQQTHKHEVPSWRKTKDHFVPKRRINWTVRSFQEQHLLK